MPKKRRHLFDSDKAAPDMSPMIDLVFLLLIFFMVASRLITYKKDENVEIPIVIDGQVPELIKGRVIINVYQDGTVYDEDSRPLTLEQVPDPRPGDGELLVRVRACAICRTDLHVIEGELPDPVLPLIPGHQAVGVVEANGRGATRFQPGDRVGVAWLGQTCGQCEWCESGDEFLCVLPGQDARGHCTDGSMCCRAGSQLSAAEEGRYLIYCLVACISRFIYSPCAHHGARLASCESNLLEELQTNLSHRHDGCRTSRSMHEQASER